MQFLMALLVKEMIKLDLNLGYHYFGPKIKIIAPWRIWKLKSRTDLFNYAKKHGITIPKDKKGASPFSVDDNIFYTSTEGKILENPKNSAPEYIFKDLFHLKKLQINQAL